MLVERKDLYTTSLDKECGSEMVLLQGASFIKEKDVLQGKSFTNLSKIAIILNWKKIKNK